jgi:hypothetical protein
MDINLDQNGNIIIEKQKANSWFTGVIGNLLKKELVESKRIKWAAEIKMLKKLEKLYPDRNFWCQLDLGYKLNSIAFLLSERGKLVLKEKYNSYKLELDLTAKTEYHFEDDKIGEDLIVSKPKSLMDFLK